MVRPYSLNQTPAEHNDGYVERAVGVKRKRFIGGKCAHGHALTPDNVLLWGKANVRCRTCSRESQRRRLGHQPRRYNVLGGVCSRGHLLTHATVYRRAGGKYQCAVCIAVRRGTATPPSPLPPAEKPCEGCGETKPIAKFSTPGTRRCRRCIDAEANVKRGAAAKADTRSRRSEARTIVAFCRTGAARLVTERGWATEQVAVALGVPVRSFRRWIAGPRLPQPRRVASLAEAMTAVLAREGLI